MVERVLGKDEVVGSIPTNGSIFLESETQPAKRLVLMWFGCLTWAGFPCPFSFVPVLSRTGG
jgi:hypothetical protein